MTEARVAIKVRRQFNNRVHPHSRLGFLSPEKSVNYSKPPEVDLRSGGELDRNPTLGDLTANSAPEDWSYYMRR